MPSVAKSDGVMVWAAINGKGRVIVKRCPKVVDSRAYQGILKESIRFIRPRCERMS
jgi:hypothetical protein